MDSEDRARVAYLVDVDAIHRTKARYCRYIDTKQWALLRTLFTDDCRFEGLGSAPDGADVETFIAGISSRLARAISVHHCHMAEVEMVGSGRAKVIWAMEDHLEWPDGADVAEAPGSLGFQGYGHYEETYAGEGGTWKIATLRLTRLGIHPLPAGWPRLGPGRRVADPDWLSAHRPPRD